MITRHIKPAFQDDRGQITDIIEHTPFDNVTVITCVKGAVRANHFHKESIQFSYVLSGRVRALTQSSDEPVKAAELSAGNLLETPAFEKHAIHALEDSVLLIITRGPRGGKNYEDDTFRVAPLQADIVPS